MYAARRTTTIDTHDVELIDVTKRFGGVVAVEGVSLRVARASYCCLLGPSGCGKTSLLRLIAGHETASEGDVLIAGANVTELPPARRGTTFDAAWSWRRSRSR